MSELEAYSLYEVNEYIKRVIALNFQEPVWIECEISQVKEVRGQVYLNLIQTAEDSDEVIAQNSATIWYKQFLFIKKKLAGLIDSILQDGVKVKVKASIEFHEKYGIKLNIVDIDPSYSLGMFELARQKIIERLKKADLIDLNQQILLPTVIQKVAVISSSQAAGFKDFQDQLLNNNYGYEFKSQLYGASMQGVNTEKEIIAALKEINAQIENYDIVIITRGGGSKIDLSSFDNYNIAHAIAKFPIPVLTGIGHEIDETVSDIVAHTVLKTPTALADFIIDHNMTFESKLIQLENELIQNTNQTVSQLKFNLQAIQQRLFQIPLQKMADKKIELSHIEMEVNSISTHLIQSLKQQLEYIEEKISLISPDEILKKGYAYVIQNSKIITKAKSIDSKEFEIVFQDGKIIAEKKSK